jgi:hypothetical protein
MALSTSSDLRSHAAADVLYSACCGYTTKTFNCKQSVLEEVTRQLGLNPSTTVCTLHSAAAAVAAGASIGGTATAAATAAAGTGAATASTGAAGSSGVHACNIATALCKIAQRGWITSTGVSDDCSCVVVDLAPLMRRGAADASL